MTRLPATARLATALTEILGAEAEIVERRANPRHSTHASELLSCLVAGSTRLELFAKYGPADAATSHGARGGVGYEAAVYQDALREVEDGVPRCYGEHAERGESWLFLELLADAHPVGTLPPERGLVEAAGWLGGFHRRFEGRPPAALRRTGAADRVAWAHRTLRYAEPRRRRRLEPLCDGYARLAREWDGRPPTFVHGELTVDNVVVCRGRVFALDWQSAAAGNGEEDLAMLTEDWPDDVVAACEERYAQARWPKGRPAGVDRALGLARLAADFRWLGEQPSLTRHPGFAWRFESLERTGRRLGLI